MESSDCFILVCFGGRPYIPYIRKDSESSCHDVSDWWNFADSAGKWNLPDYEFNVTE